MDELNDAACVAERMVKRASFEAAIRSGGAVVFPADTVYGLACDPESAAAVENLYRLKGRAPDKPAAVMFFSLQAAEPVLEDLPGRVRDAALDLLPGPVTLLVPDPQRRFALAGGADVLGLRVPDVPDLAAVSVPVLQSSANVAGGPDPVRLSDVPAAIREGAAFVLDGGELPGTPSTVVDLTSYEVDGSWTIVRAGAMPESAIAAVLAG